jgi:hypothetical protein
MSKNGHRNPKSPVLSISAPEAHDVYVAGTFNNWNPRSHPLRRTRRGRWESTLDVLPGRYEYKFVIDGRWCCEDGCDGPFDGRPGHTQNPFGTMNLTILVNEPRPAHAPATGPLL